MPYTEILLLKNKPFSLNISKIMKSRIFKVTAILLFVLNGAASAQSAFSSRAPFVLELPEVSTKRYTAPVAAGVFYIAVGLFGGAVVALLMAFPRELVVALAGFALLGSIGGGLAGALADERHREAALITFLVTLSGLTLGGIGSAFWGVVAGAIALAVQHYRLRSHE